VGERQPSDEVSNGRPHPAVLEAVHCRVRPARRGVDPVRDGGARGQLWVDTDGRGRWGRVDEAPTGQTGLAP